MPRLSVVVPVFNERETIRRIIELVREVPVDKEILVVDDGSTDGTREALGALAVPDVRVLYHDRNRGKGRAVRTGIEAAAGQALIIQDADLEYDPRDYGVLLEALERSGADVVYGSRFLDKKGVTSAWHRGVNFFLTFLTNLLYGSCLTDMETCYKLFRTDAVRRLGLSSDGFEIEVEITAKLLRARQRIVEVPISYKGRSFHEGKKIGWKDGVRAVAELVRYRFS